MTWDLNIRRDDTPIERATPAQVALNAARAAAKFRMERASIDLRLKREREAQARSIAESVSVLPRPNEVTPESQALGEAELATECAEAQLAKAIAVAERLLYDGNRCRIKHIKRAVASYFDISETDLVSHCKMYDIAFPRQIAMYLCRRYTGASMPLIGRLMKRDHTTVLHAVNKIDKLYESDGQIRRTIDLIRDRAGLEPAA
jgi:chromosomal replication initiation ATPase DnaA